MVLFLQIVVQASNGQTLTYTDLLNLVDNSEYPFDSYEFLENKGFIFTESQDYAVALDLETTQGRLRVEGCKMTYYNMDEAYCRINIHSCPPGKNIPMSDFDSKKYVTVMFFKNSNSYNYLIDKIKEYCTVRPSEPLHAEDQHVVTTHTYKHKAKDIYFNFYKYLNSNGMLYVIHVAM